MTAKPTPHRPAWGPAVTVAQLRRLAQAGARLGVQAVILFGTAGRLDWPWAWTYCGVCVALIGLETALIWPRHPERAAERGQVKGNVKGWGQAFAVRYAVLSLIVFAVAGLDYRYAWTPAPLPELAWMGLVGLLFGSMLANWARLTDHGRWVTTGGPYRLVRHPACLGLIVSALGTAVMLGSDWAMLPTGLLIGLVVIRTVLEDRALQAELPGYLGYTRRVPFRLLPGLW